MITFLSIVCIVLVIIVMSRAKEKDQKIYDAVMDEHNSKKDYTVPFNKNQKGLSRYFPFQGLYRYIDPANNIEYFLVILRSYKALLLFDDSEEIINIQNLSRLYKESCETFEEMADSFALKEYESSLNLFKLSSIGKKEIIMFTEYQQLYGQEKFQNLLLDGYLSESQNDDPPFLNINLQVSLKKFPNSVADKRYPKMTNAKFQKII